jgi:bifunctional non-homologous end joining protein LigD
VEITHPERVVFPDDAITKGDVVAYYETVAERLLPFVAGRDLTVQRFPKGIGQPGFMQKNAPDHYPKGLIRRHRVGKGDGGTTVYPVIDSAEAIGFFANLGVITFHVPAVRVADRTHPDWAIWDLDPPPGEVGLVRRAADTMHSFLDSLGIPTHLLASGSNGYHLRVRLDGSLTANAIERLARGAAVLAATEHDELFTVAFRKADRGSRVFVDWMRNNPMATSVAPWSLRPRRGAPVAAPLSWNELPTFDPQGVTLGTVTTRLRADPWSGARPVDLSAAAKTVAGALDERGIELKPFDRFRS